MLSLKKGRPIAKFITGKNKGKVTLNIIEDKKDFTNEAIGKEFTTKDELLPVPNVHLEREVCYIAGPSGSGKSTMCSNYIKTFKKVFPNNSFFLFSRKPSDKILDKLKPLRVPLNQDIVDNPIDINQDINSGSLLLFDDCDTINDLGIKTAVNALLRDVLETGRSHNLSCILTSHLINGTDKNKTKTIFNEAHNITIFPQSGNPYAINYALKNYLGFDSKTISKILKLPSRWVFISKTYPVYVLYENGAYIV